MAAAVYATFTCSRCPFPHGIAPHLKHRDVSKFPGSDAVHAVKGHDVGLEGLLPRSHHPLQDGTAPMPLVSSGLVIRPTRGIQLGALEGLGGTSMVGPPAGARDWLAWSRRMAGPVVWAADAVPCCHISLQNGDWFANRDGRCTTTLRT